MSQTQIEFYTDYKVPSVSSDGEYNVRFGPEGWECDCPHMRYRKRSGTFCRHILSVRVQQLKEKIRFITNIDEKPSHAFFESVDEIAKYFLFRNDIEFNRICWAILFLARSQGRCTADDVHDVFLNRFDHDPRIIGTAIRNLKQKGYLEQIGMENSRRKECHCRPIGIFVLSEDGDRIFFGGN